MTSSILQLPFVQAALGTATLYWAVEPTGDWAKDNARGRLYADDLVAAMRESNAPFALGHVAKAIGAVGRPWSGIEAGFFQGIADHATAA